MIQVDGYDLNVHTRPAFVIFFRWSVDSHLAYLYNYYVFIAQRPQAG